MTAAPRMMRAVGASSSPIADRTRAVMPTDVATIAVPTKSASMLVLPQARMRSQPPRSGARTPSTATTAACFPTLKMAAGLVSSPTVNRRKMTPISANRLVISDGAAQPRRLGPIMTPANISPATAGCRSRSNNSAMSFAATSIMKRVKRTLVSSPVAVARK